MLYVDWLKKYPEDLQLKSEDADNASWLGNIELEQGNLELAESYFKENDLALQEIGQRDPKNAKWQEYRLISLQLLLDVQIKLGKLALARDTNADAMAMEETMVRQDAKKKGWQ